MRFRRSDGTELILQTRAQGVVDANGNTLRVTEQKI